MFDVSVRELLSPSNHGDLPRVDQYTRSSLHRIATLLAWLKEYFIFHFRCYQRAYDEVGTEKIGVARAKLAKDWDTFIDAIGMLRRGDGNPTTVAEAVARGFCSVFFARIPLKPEQGKWTQTSPANDWFMALNSVMSDFFENLVDAAYGGCVAIVSSNV